jgi:hypothetical protein
VSDGVSGITCAGLGPRQLLKVREALRDLRNEADKSEVTFTGHDGKPYTMVRSVFHLDGRTSQSNPTAASLYAASWAVFFVPPTPGANLRVLLRDRADGARFTEPSARRVARDLVAGGEAISAEVTKDDVPAFSFHRQPDGSIARREVVS